MVCDITELRYLINRLSSKVAECHRDTKCVYVERGVLRWPTGLVSQGHKLWHIFGGNGVTINVCEVVCGETRFKPSSGLGIRAFCVMICPMEKSFV